MTLPHTQPAAEGRRARDPRGSLDTGVGVLDRSIGILDAIERGARTHAEVVSATRIPRTTAHRLLKSLEAHGLIALVGGQGYRLGPRFLRLAASSLKEIPLRDVAHPALERLAEATGESAQLFVLSAGARVCVDAVPSSSELRTIVDVGAELPLTAGSAGKVFMAWLPAARDDLVHRTRPLTEATPTGDRLRRQLATARRRGWASSAGERHPGVGSVSAPILGRRGELIAVVSISGPTGRVGRVSAKRYAPAVVAAAHEIERTLADGSA
jgi:DNA-binding IclR family transcriptional regulator